MICTSYWHALRASEICGLTFADIDKENDAIRIRRLKDSLETKQAFRKQRGVPLLDEGKALRSWLAERPADDQSSVIFTSQKGGEMDRATFWRMFQDVAEVAGIPKDKRNTWTMPPLALLERPGWSPGRKAGMLLLRGYLVVAVLLLVVRTVQLGH